MSEPFAAKPSRARYDSVGSPHCENAVPALRSRTVTAGIRHHVKEEESEVFPKLKQNHGARRLAKLGDEVAMAKKAKPA